MEATNKNFRDTFNFIMDNTYKDTKERLIDEAREFFAKKYSCLKEDVWYGNLTASECPNPFPYKIVIGDIDLRYAKIDMAKLRHVGGTIRSNMISEFPNLESVNNIADIAGLSENGLPKLKRCFNLIISGSCIKDISSLEEVGILQVNYTDIEKVNPNLEIMQTLHCEHSNHFEEKLDISKKHGWWYTDNPKIL